MFPPPQLWLFQFSASTLHWVRSYWEVQPIRRERETVQNKPCPSREGHSELRGLHRCSHILWPGARGHSTGSPLSSPWVCQSIRTEMFTHHLIHREQQCNRMLHTQVRMQLQTAFLVIVKEKKKNRKTSLCHWDKPPTWKASNFGSTTTTGWLLRAQGHHREITLVMFYLKKSLYPHAVNLRQTTVTTQIHSQWGPETTCSTLLAGHQPQNINISAL